MTTARKAHGRSRHPLVRVAGTVGRLPRYAKLGRRLVADDQIAAWRKAALLAGLGYLAWPVDLVPGFIPVAGQLDDLAAVLIGLNVALEGCSEERAAEHLAAVGLTPTALDDDIAKVKLAAIWLAKGGARAGRAAVRLPLRVARRVLGPIPQIAAAGARRGASAYAGRRQARPPAAHRTGAQG